MTRQLTLLTVASAFLIGVSLLRASGAEVEWRTWSKLEVENARRHYPILVEFSARWDVTSLHNRKSVLESEEVAALLSSRGVNCFRADCTEKDVEIEKALKDLGSSTVPTYVFCVPGEKECMVFTDLLQKDVFIGKLRVKLEYEEKRAEPGATDNPDDAQ